MKKMVLLLAGLLMVGTVANADVILTKEQCETFESDDYTRVMQNDTDTVMVMMEIVQLDEATTNKIIEESSMKSVMKAYQNGEANFTEEMRIALKKYK